MLETQMYSYLFFVALAGLFNAEMDAISNNNKPLFKGTWWLDTERIPFKGIPLLYWFVKVVLYPLTGGWHLCKFFMMVSVGFSYHYFQSYGLMWDILILILTFGLSFNLSYHGRKIF